MLRVYLWLIFVLCAVCGRPAFWNWFGDEEENDEVADRLSESSLFYSTFTDMQKKFDTYAPAQHTGKIYRGHYQKPQYLMPRYRTFGWDSDFREADVNAFRNAPKMPNSMCQDVRRPPTYKGFDCRCGVPNREEKDPHSSPRGTIPNPNIPIPGQPQTAEIIGGVTTEKSEYPWQVSLTFKLPPHINIKNPVCGGSIISSKSIITTAHCVALEELLPFLPSWVNVEEMIKVMVSQHEWPMERAQEFSICRRHIHPGWDLSTVTNDFAILELCEEIHFHQAAQPICLPSLAGHQYDGVPGIVSGWGVDRNSWPLHQPDKLKEANMTTIPNSVCSEFLHSTMGVPLDFLDNSKMCVRGDEQYVCLGDNGGPLIVQEPCGHYALVGGSSFLIGGCVFPSSGPYKGIFPSVYARVTHVLPWIEQTMQGETCPPPSRLKYASQ